MFPSRPVALRLFGNASLTDADGSRLGGPAAQRHRLALLAVLAVHGEEGRSREQLLALLWPERDAVHARQLLKQAVYSVRKALGENALLSAGTDLRLNPTVISSDVGTFEAALARGSREAAVALYRGPFLDGFALPDAPEFERWVDQERGRLAAAYGRALEALASVAEDEHDFGAAVERWRARAAHDPYDSRVALRLMRALEASGNRAGALQHAALHRRLLQAELGVEPTPEVRAMAERLARAAAVDPPERAAGGVSAAIGGGGQPSGPLARREAPLPAQASTSPGAPAAEEGPPSAPSGPIVAPELPVAPASTPPSPRRAASRRPRRRLLYGAAALSLVAVLVSTWLGLTPRDRGSPGTEDAIARVVGRELDARLGRIGPGAPRRPGTRNVAAYDLYARGSDRTRLRSDSAALEGVELLRQAVALDPTYAAAWAALALMHHRVSIPEGGPTLSRQTRERHRRLADRAARQAVALDDSLSEAHLMMGKARMVEFDLASAERHLTRAAALDPTHPEPHALMVPLYLWLGRRAEALAHAERGVALDSLSPAAHAELARALLGLDRCDEALVALETLSRLRPPLLRAADFAAQCHARTGRWLAGVAALQPQAARGVPSALGQTAYMLARAGRQVEARRIHGALLERSRRGDGGAFQVGLVYAGLGDLDQALAWFERALGDGSLHGGPSSPGLMLVVPGPLAADLYRHVRFERLRERIRLPRPASLRVAGARRPTSSREASDRTR